LAHQLFVTDQWIPENSVLAAWRRNAECDDLRVKLIASATNLAEQTVLARFEKLNDENDCRTQTHGPAWPASPRRFTTPTSARSSSATTSSTLAVA
jgi:hypothetical protein